MPGRAAELRVEPRAQQAGARVERRVEPAGRLQPERDRQRLLEQRPARHRGAGVLARERRAGARDAVELLDHERARAARDEHRRRVERCPGSSRRGARARHAPRRRARAAPRRAGRPALPERERRLAERRRRRSRRRRAIAAAAAARDHARLRLRRRERGLGLEHRRDPGARGQPPRGGGRARRAGRRARSRRLPPAPRRPGRSGRRGARASRARPRSGRRARSPARCRDAARPPPSRRPPARSISCSGGWSTAPIHSVNAARAGCPRSRRSSSAGACRCRGRSPLRDVARLVEDRRAAPRRPPRSRAAPPARRAGPRAASASRSARRCRCCRPTACSRPMSATLIPMPCSVVAATKMPPPGPLVARIRCALESSRSASRSVGRLTPNRCARSSSRPSRSPGARPRPACTRGSRPRRPRWRCAAAPARAPPRLTSPGARAAGGHGRAAPCRCSVGRIPGLTGTMRTRSPSVWRSRAWISRASRAWVELDLDLDLVHRMRVVVEGDRELPDAAASGAGLLDRRREHVHAADHHHVVHSPKDAVREPHPVVPRGAARRGCARPCRPCGNGSPGSRSAPARSRPARRPRPRRRARRSPGRAPHRRSRPRTGGCRRRPRTDRRTSRPRSQPA